MTDDRLAQRVLTRLLEARGEPDQLVLGHAIDGQHGHDLGPAVRQRARLVEDERVDVLEPLEGVRIAEQHTGLRTAAHRDRHGHGSREPQRARARNDEGAHRDDERVREPRLRSDAHPDDRSEDGDRDYGRHEPRGHTIGQRLHRCTAALRVGDGLHDLRQQRRAADPLGAHDEGAPAIDGAADQMHRQAPCRQGSIHR